MRLIEMRAKLIELFHEKNSKYHIFCDDCLGKEPEELNYTMGLLADHLIANGVTVQKKGEWRWEKGHNGNYWYQCSECGCTPHDNFSFCPWCGADMRG